MMGFTDELIGLDLRHRRELAGAASRAQAVVDELDARIDALQRKLAQTQRQLATANTTVADLKTERGQRNMRVALETLARNRRH